VRPFIAGAPSSDPPSTINFVVRRARPGDKWHLDEVAIRIRGSRHWLWRAVDQNGVVLDILVQSRRDQHAAERFLRQLIGQWLPAAGCDHGQAGKLPTGHQTGLTERGSPPPPRLEQPSRKLAPPRSEARACAAAFQISRAMLRRFAPCSAPSIATSVRGATACPQAATEIRALDASPHGGRWWNSPCVRLGAADAASARPQPATARLM
jgi:hypothetical protein